MSRQEHLAQVGAAIQRTRRRAQVAEADADASGELLDTLLDLVAERVIVGLRERGWIEFHRDRPTDTSPTQRSPQDDVDETGPRPAVIPTTTRKQDTH